MADTDTASADAPAKSDTQIAAEAIIALKAPGYEMSQLTVGSDAVGDPNMIVIYLRKAAQDG